MPESKSSKKIRSELAHIIFDEPKDRGWWTRETLERVADLGEWRADFILARDAVDQKDEKEILKRYRRVIKASAVNGYKEGACLELGRYLAEKGGAEDRKEADRLFAKAQKKYACAAAFERSELSLKKLTKAGLKESLSFLRTAVLAGKVNSKGFMSWNAYEAAEQIGVHYRLSTDFSLSRSNVWFQIACFMSPESGPLPPEWEKVKKAIRTKKEGNLIFFPCPWSGPPRDTFGSIYHIGMKKGG